MTTDQVRTHEVVEHFIRMLVTEADADPRTIMVGVHNAFVHGDILLERNDYSLGENDVHLKEFFRGIEISQAALKAMRECVLTLTKRE